MKPTMKTSVAQGITVEIEAQPFEGLGSVKCTSCEGYLDVCQPDPNRSDRFLATCSECGSWHLMRHQADDQVVQLVSLQSVFDIKLP
jgi:hypothetical protein